MPSRTFSILLALGVLGVAGVGCQPARRYESPPPSVTSTPEPEKKPPVRQVEEAFVFDDPSSTPPSEVVPIRFVHRGTSEKGWEQLSEFWNDPTEQETAVRIKVPLGLPDPTPFVPQTNPMTLGKWTLGKRLFFDKTILRDSLDLSCADCHDPERDYTDQKNHSGYNTASLVNSVYNRTQFWDGRARYLEETVQQTPEDEIAKPSSTFRHSWPNVVARLRLSVTYRDLFEKTFGGSPNQNSLGQALATYMRTILSGDALYDRAVLEQSAKKSDKLLEEHWRTRLDVKVLEGLDREGVGVDKVAQELQSGYARFHNQFERRTTNCIVCHPAPLFRDGAFHNLDVGPIPGPYRNAGRFAHVPFGEKRLRLIGAYATPSLRNPVKTFPYLHTGESSTLSAAIRYHDDDTRWNPYLDSLLLESGKIDQRRKLGLTKEELAALILFVRSLQGQRVDAKISDPPKLVP